MVAAELALSGAKALGISGTSFWALLPRAAARTCGETRQPTLIQRKEGREENRYGYQTPSRMTEVVHEDERHRAGFEARYVLVSA